MSESILRPYKKVSMEQLKLLIDFMSQHAELAAGTYRTLEARHQSRLLWSEVAKVLNGHKGGTRRPSNGWSKYWSDFKIKLKNKLIELKKRRLGIIKNETTSPITKLEKRALHILGPNFEKKYIGENGFEEPSSDPLPLEIKQESITLNNGYYRTPSSDDRLSDSDVDNNHQQSDEEVEEEQTFDEPAMNNIYPKWLIEVEKKRAEAELRRAKAEELRAEIAVKNSDAAFIQSQALKKLADAADRQADAIFRIAVALENRREESREDILNL